MVVFLFSQNRKLDIAVDVVFYEGKSMMCGVTQVTRHFFCHATKLAEYDNNKNFINVGW